jgi:hypothetical protein
MVKGEKSIGVNSIEKRLSFMNFIANTPNLSGFKLARKIREKQDAPETYQHLQVPPSNCLAALLHSLLHSLLDEVSIGIYFIKALLGERG